MTSELRGSTHKFDFKKNCFICSTTADEKGKLEQSRRKPFRLVTTIEFKDKMLQKCDERNW